MEEKTIEELMQDAFNQPLMVSFNESGLRTMILKACIEKANSCDTIDNVFDKAKEIRNWVNDEFQISISS